LRRIENVHSVTGSDIALSQMNLFIYDLKRSRLLQLISSVTNEGNTMQFSKRW
jgi:hypothetical protein